jgi:hypothetical protein
LLALGTGDVKNALRAFVLKTAMSIKRASLFNETLTQNRLLGLVAGSGCSSPLSAEFSAGSWVSMRSVERLLESARNIYRMVRKLPGQVGLGLIRQTAANERHRFNPSSGKPSEKNSNSCQKSA